MMKPIVVSCVGDSVTEGMNTTGGLKGVNAYPYVLGQLLQQHGSFTVHNFGKWGRTALKVSDMPYYDQPEYTDSLNCSPDVVIIGFGANDSKEINWNPAAYREDMLVLIQTYRALPSHPTVYLNRITCVADQGKTTCRDAVIQGEILPILDEIAAQTDCKLIDLNTLSLQHKDEYFDGVHPFDPLQRRMGEYVYNVLCSEGIGGLTAENATETVAAILPKKKN